MNTLRTLQLARALADPGETIWRDISETMSARIGEGFGAGLQKQINGFARQRARVALENRKEGAYNEFLRTKTQALAWDAEPTYVQLPRDQSEDRKAPKFLVQYREGSEFPWEVVRAKDRLVMAQYGYASAATDRAVREERQRGGE